MIRIEKTAPRFTLVMTIEHMGKDLNVSLYGGDDPHIGAVALAVPHAGLRNREKIDASVSLLTVCGHKEDELARKFSYELASTFNCTVSVVCGIHLENATRQEITDVLETAHQMLEQALKDLS
ncbi:hypothetical protein [Desulfovibrio sp. JC022]|uniref:prenylated flavin chaperone LpdD n=1 Tax=Desulfovibrio sp. JC022 TaxID=2593642 RepID=UPI0013D4E7FC|nr:hypothetical protein [Desulfovibrio sp. JC022]NDV21199.1 hypothetical protein [Desulfovibrio sp. JC022]